jgi:hypothetical protein
LERSGEGGELLLFALAEKLLRLPQLICKMSLKTNTRMHIHGADGLHAGVDDETGKLVLYWGESKIYGDVVAAVRDCLASLAPMLQDHEASKRDLQLLQRHLDVDNEALEDALKKFLNPDDPAYPPDPSAKAELNIIVDAITTTLPKWKEHLIKRVAEEKLDAFAMHFLFVPFPSADGFRDLFREHLGLTTSPPGVPATVPAQPKSSVASGRRSRLKNGAQSASRQSRPSKATRRSPRGAS